MQTKVFSQFSESSLLTLELAEMIIIMTKNVYPLKKKKKKLTI